MQRVRQRFISADRQFGMIDTAKPFLVGQGSETFSFLKLLYSGVAKQLEPEFVGDLRFLFNGSEGASDVRLRFNWVSSVLYCDEMLWSVETYPYFKDVGGTSGLFEVEGSSYLKRIEPFFPDHRHFIYFDMDFNWHITASNIELLP